MKKIFLDTNILIDFLDDTREGFSLSQKILQQCIQKKIKLGMSEDMITTVFYVCRKKIPSVSIIQFFRVFEKIGTIECFGASVRNNAFDFCEQHKNADLEDVLQAFCAKENAYDMLISSDKNFVKDIISVSFSGDDGIV